MLALKQVASKLRNILFRFDQYRAPDCGTFVQVEIAEVPGMVTLELKLAPFPPTST